MFDSAVPINAMPFSVPLQHLMSGWLFKYNLKCQSVDYDENEQSRRVSVTSSPSFRPSVQFVTRVWPLQGWRPAPQTNSD